jgi:hypothetical protein
MFTFKNNIGCIICDKCRKIIDSGIEYEDYKEDYHTKEDNLCDKCLEQINKGKL